MDIGAGWFFGRHTHADIDKYNKTAIISQNTALVLTNILIYDIIIYQNSSLAIKKIIYIRSYHATVTSFYSIYRW
jgi:hypothetical protein